MPLAATPEMCITKRVSFPERVKPLNAHDNASDCSIKCALWCRIWRNMHIQGKTTIACLLRNYRSRAFIAIKSCRAAIWWHLLGTRDLKHVRTVPVNQVLFECMQVSALDFFVWNGLYVILRAQLRERLHLIYFHVTYIVHRSLWLGNALPLYTNNTLFQMFRDISVRCGSNQKGARKEKGSDWQPVKASFSSKAASLGFNAEPQTMRLALIQFVSRSVNTAHFWSQSGKIDLKPHSELKLQR